MAATCSRPGDDTFVCTSSTSSRLPKNAHGLVSTDLAPEPLVETLDWQERYRHGNTAFIWMQSVAVTNPAILLPPFIQQSCELKPHKQIILYCDKPARHGHR